MNGNIKKSNLVRRMFIIQIILFPNLYNYDLDHFDFETKSMYLTERPPYHEKIKLTWKSGTISNVNLTTDMVSGFNPTKLGEQKLTVTYDLNYTLSDSTTIADKIVDEYYVVVVNLGL